MDMDRNAVDRGPEHRSTRTRKETAASSFPREGWGVDADAHVHVHGVRSMASCGPEQSLQLHTSFSAAVISNHRAPVCSRVNIC